MLLKLEHQRSLAWPLVQGRHANLCLANTHLLSVHWTTGINVIPA